MYQQIKNEFKDLFEDHHQYLNIHIILILNSAMIDKKN